MRCVIECLIHLLRVENALELVPVEYEKAYNWFQTMEGKCISRLPMGSYTPEGFDHPLARQAGIYRPSYRTLKSKGHTRCGEPAKPYALSVHSEGQTRYADKDALVRQDGTWILDYKAQRAKSGPAISQGYNKSLRNCLEDGVPVGVMVKSSKGYKVLGLAYVEKYNTALDMFTLHGPVNAKTELQGSFDLLEDMAICPPEAKKSLDWSGDDERKMVLRERAIREGQGRFRKEVFRAYGGACALTDVNVPEVLQAAHIDSYRGQYTQVVGNGILLRSDIHLLYDAQLLAIRPESHVIEVSKRLLGTPYECLAKAFVGGRPRTLRVPEYSDDAPIEELLELHYREFLIANAAR